MTSPVFGEVVYDNSAHDLLRRFNPGIAEIGDEIRLSGAARLINSFTFEYWGENSFGGGFLGDVQARVCFYRNDGARSSSGYPAPGTVLFDSDWFAVDPTPRATLTFDDFVTGAVVPLTGPAPDSFTWTVRFSGLGFEDSAGVDIFSPPVVGASLPDYWQLSFEGEWLLLTNSVPMNFAAYIEAVPATDPTPVSLAIASQPGCVVISWPGFGPRFSLQSTPSLNSPVVWNAVTNSVVVISNRSTVTIQEPAAQQFFQVKIAP